MKYRLKSSTAAVRKVLMRDAHDPDRVYVQITSEDDAVLERNKAIRNARLMQIGQRVSALGDEHADVSASFQFPTVTDFQLAKAKHPDIFAELDLGGEHSIRAGEKLAFLFPQYVTMVRRRDRVQVPKTNDRDAYGGGLGD